MSNQCPIPPVLTRSTSTIIPDSKLEEKKHETQSSQPDKPKSYARKILPTQRITPDILNVEDVCKNHVFINYDQLKDDPFYANVDKKDELLRDLLKPVIEKKLNELKNKK